MQLVVGASSATSTADTLPIWCAPTRRQCCAACPPLTADRPSPPESRHLQFGGQALAAPTRYALAPAVLPGTPRHYDFGDFGANRAESIEALYGAFNEAGEQLSSDAQQQIVDEANLAFALNVIVYKEEGGLWRDAAKGVGNMVSGFVGAKARALVG